MKRPVAFAASATLAALLAVAPALAAVRVPLNQVLRVNVRGAAADVVVGNSEIADVNIVDNRTIFIIGKRAGTTNLVVLDAGGRTLFSDTVTVGAAGGGSASTVTIARGTQVQVVSCEPACSAPVGPDGQPAAAAIPVAAPAPSSVPAPAPSAQTVIESSAPGGAASSGSSPR